VPLTPPDVPDLQFHMRESSPITGIQAQYAEDSLQRATDLAEVATGLHEDPEDELALRLLTTGILSMAHSIYVTSGEDSEATYAPFSSERLGSYSYSKMAQAVEEKAATGVEAFDQMVKYFAGLDQAAGGDAAVFSLHSEQVWEQPYKGSQDTEKLRDPQVPLSVDAWNQ
jgi:hypothetical protein